MKSENITCQECSSAFVWETDLSPGDAFYSISRPCYCPPCAEIVTNRAEEQHRLHLIAQRDQQVAEFVEKVRASIPVLFQRTDIKDPRFNSAAWAKLQNWRPTDEKPWLGLIGNTGTSKSRIAHLLAMKIIREIAERHFAEFTGRREPRILFATSYEITEAVMAQFSGRADSFGGLSGSPTPAQDARGFLDSIRNAAFVMIDDLGKGRLSPAVAAEVFAIINHRYVNSLTTIWTANSTPEEIASGMSSDMGAPFSGRLNDSSLIVRFK